MLKKYICSKKGFSLVEVLLASALLLFVFTGFVSAFSYSVNLRANNQSRLQAMLKAQECLEEIRGARGEQNGEWSDIDELKALLVDTLGYTEQDDGEFTKDNIIISLTSSDPGIPEKLIPISVAVSYQNHIDKGKTLSVNLKTRFREF